jgi:hypothetical protein
LRGCCCHKRIGPRETLTVYDDEDDTKPLHYTCQVKLDDEGTKSVMMNAKLSEDIGETAMGQRDIVMGWV